MDEWRFKTKRYEIFYWATEFFAAAEIYLRAKPPLMLAVAIGVRGGKSKRELVREAIDRATDRLDDLLQSRLN